MRRRAATLFLPRPSGPSTSHILRFGACATDAVPIPPDVFDPALDEVDFGGEQPAAA